VAVKIGGVMRAVFLISAICFGLTGPFAGAQNGLTGENLLVEIPTGYELAYSQKTDTGTINEFVPKGETVEKWSEMITVQLFPPHDNAKFYATFESLVKQSCRSGFTHEVATQKENGYPVKVFHLLCPTNLQTDLGEVTFLKTIEGRDKFYVVQKAWHTEKFEPDWIPISAEEIVKWTEYLRSVSVCDSRIKKRKCP
jgi:hypothetical protein